MARNTGAGITLAHVVVVVVGGWGGGGTAVGTGEGADRGRRGGRDGTMTRVECRADRPPCGSRSHLVSGCCGRGSALARWWLTAAAAAPRARRAQQRFPSAHILSARAYQIWCCARPAGLQTGPGPRGVGPTHPPSQRGDQRSSPLRQPARCPAHRHRRTPNIFNT